MVTAIARLLTSAVDIDVGVSDGVSDAESVGVADALSVTLALSVTEAGSVAIGSVAEVSTLEDGDGVGVGVVQDVTSLFRVDGFLQDV